MMDCDRWDIVTALFPFTDSAIRKPRPVLVLSNRQFNRDHGHLIGCMITTGARSWWKSDVPIAELEFTGLSHPSVIRWKLFTLPFEVLGKRIGALSDQDRVSMKMAFARILL